MRKIICFTSLMIVLNGCASMFGDNTRVVKIQSDQPNTQIYVNGVSRGVTGGSAQTEVQLDSYLYGNSGIVLKKQGYNDTYLPINTTANWSTLWNILNGFGFIIDAATGDIIKISPESRNLYGNMTPVTATVNESSAVVTKK